MVYMAPSYVPRESGLNQPSMSGSRMFGGMATPIHFGLARPVLTPGLHKPLTASVHVGLFAPAARPVLGGTIDRYVG